MVVDRRPRARSAGSSATQPGAPRPLRGSPAGDLRRRPGFERRPWHRGARMIARRIATLTLALVAAVGLLGTPVGPTAPAEVRAAAQPLRFTSNARYDVQPAQRRIRVIVDLRMTNPSKDTATTAYYYDHAFVQVMGGAGSFKVDGPGSPRVRVVERRKQDVQLRIDFGRRLTSGKSATYRLTFYLKDPGGAATRDLRVGDSLVSFPVWAFATGKTPGSTVTVVFPKGFDVEVGPARSRLRPPRRTVGRSSAPASSPSPSSSSPISSPIGPAPTVTTPSRPTYWVPPSGSTSGHGRTTSPGRSGSAPCSTRACPRSGPGSGSIGPTIPSP